MLLAALLGHILVDAPGADMVRYCSYVAQADLTSVSDDIGQLCAGCLMLLAGVIGPDDPVAAHSLLARAHAFYRDRFGPHHQKAVELSGLLTRVQADRDDAGKLE